MIGFIAYLFAYDKVGDMYHSHVISGQMSGSFFHWIIRAACFIGLWAVTYGVIWIGKFVIANKVLVGSSASWAAGHPSANSWMYNLLKAICLSAESSELQGNSFYA